MSENSDINIERVKESLYLYRVEEQPDWHGMSDLAVVREMGARIKQYRLNFNLTQKEVAQNAGIHRSTLSALENDGTATLITLAQVLRALQLLGALDSFLPDPGLSPLQLAEFEGKKRQRASSTGKDNTEASW